MNILITHYSRTGYTEKLADELASKLQEAGHSITCEQIKVVRDWNKWVLPIPLLPLLPFLPIYLLWPAFRRIWHLIYFQPEQEIQPLVVPDVSGFDLVLLGTPKWLYLSFPVARWLRQIEGLQGVRVAPFATFCGPPLQAFEVDMLFEPLEKLIRKRGGEVCGRLHLSSDFHPYFWKGEMQFLFRWLSVKIFKRPLRDFTLHGELGSVAVQEFCDAMNALEAPDRSA